MREVNGGRAMLATSLFALITITMFLSLFSFLGLTIYFGFKFGLWVAVKFVGLSFLFEFPIALIVGRLHLLRFAWAISLFGIVLIPLIVGIMLYATFHR